MVIHTWCVRVGEVCVRGASRKAQRKEINCNKAAEVGLAETAVSPADLESAGGRGPRWGGTGRDGVRGRETEVGGQGGMGRDGAGGRGTGISVLGRTWTLNSGSSGDLSHTAVSERTAAMHHLTLCSAGCQWALRRKRRRSVQGRVLRRNA